MLSTLVITYLEYSFVTGVQRDQQINTAGILIPVTFYTEHLPYFTLTSVLTGVLWHSGIYRHIDQTITSLLPVTNI